MVKNWTTKEIEYIRKKALFAETNAVLNIDELAKRFSRSPKAIEMKIYKLRRDGQLPKVDHTKAFDVDGRRFNAEEDKRIIAMYKHNESYKNIGESLGRSEQSIAGRISRLKRNGKLKQTLAQKNWTNEEVEILLENIRFDENGFCCNHSEVARLCNRTYEQVVGKINRLRNEGLINVLPDKSKTSMKSKKAMDRFNCARFGKRMEDNPVKEESIQNVLQVETQSKMVQVIMTTIITGNIKTVNFFTSEGELLAVKQEPASSANDTSH